MRKITFSIILILTVFLFGCKSYVTDISKDPSVERTDISFINREAGYKFGNDNAKIVIVEYSSYECIDCMNLHNNIKDSLKKAVESGNVLYIYKPIDHPKFENDDKINRYFEPKSLDDLSTIYSKFSDYSKKNWDNVKSVLRLSEVENSNYKNMSEIISNELKNGNISRTPTIFINNRKFVERIFTPEEFEKLINEELNKK